MEFVGIDKENIPLGQRAGFFVYFDIKSSRADLMGIREYFLFRLLSAFLSLFEKIRLCHINKLYIYI